jgi:hypothetical protein
MDKDPRKHSAPAERNRGPIAEQLLQWLPPRGRLLEIASGTGQHAAHVAPLLPGWSWQPSDFHPGSLASIEAWCAGLVNVHKPLLLDVMAEDWPGVTTPLDAIFCANMLHIAPWPVCGALMRGAARTLGPQGQLVLYGPYIVDGEPTAASNLAFDEDLRGRNPAWGLRVLSEVLAEAQRSDLHLVRRVEMPANNLLLVLSRDAI